MCERSPKIATIEEKISALKALKSRKAIVKTTLNNCLKRAEKIN